MSLPHNLKPCSAATKAKQDALQLCEAEVEKVCQPVSLAARKLLDLAENFGPVDIWQGNWR